MNAKRLDESRRQEPTPEAYFTSVPATGAAGEDLDAREDEGRLRRVPDGMDPRTRALLWLCAAERMPIEEAARVLRRPASTLRYQLNKALERARREMRAPLDVKIQLTHRHELR